AQVFWAQLARRTGLGIYNVAVSGLGPGDYLNQFAAFALERRPRLALFAIYEGNDFKELNSPAAKRRVPRRALGRALGWLDGDSPLRQSVKNALVESLAPIRIGTLPSVAGLDAIPVALSGEAGTAFYAFEPKQLLGLESADAFAASHGWRSAAQSFETI